MVALPREPCTGLSTPSKILSGFHKCGKEPGGEPWIDIKISGSALWPPGGYVLCWSLELKMHPGIGHMPDTSDGYKKKKYD